MSRTMFSVSYTIPFEEAHERIDRTLRDEGYFPTKIATGENVWRKGEGIATGMKFIKVEYGLGAANFYGWVQISMYPGDKTGNEDELKGFVAGLPKKQVKGTIQKVMAALVQ